jgi:hypothetical protein
MNTDAGHGVVLAFEIMVEPSSIFMTAPNYTTILIIKHGAWLREFDGPPQSCGMYPVTLLMATI